MYRTLEENLPVESANAQVGSEIPATSARASRRLIAMDKPCAPLVVRRIPIMDEARGELNLPPIMADEEGEREDMAGRRTKASELNTMAAAVKHSSDKFAP